MIFSWKISRKEKIFWHPDNGVRHDFERTIIGYMRQQARFARDAVQMFRDNRGLPAARTHHGKQLYLETAAFCLALVAGSLLQWRLALAAMLLLFVINLPFLLFLCRSQTGLVVAAPALIIFRELAILWGALLGAWRCCFPKKTTG